MKHWIKGTLMVSLAIGLEAMSPYAPKVEKIDVSGLSDTTNHSFVVDNQLFVQRWDTLAQTRFWRTVMNMEADSAVVNIGSTREQIEKVAMKEWDKQSDDEKQAYRDSIRTYYCLPAEEHIYLTKGKSDFYEFERTLPGINRAIEIFEREQTDPFYAQAILLIESPGKLARSPVGAYGSFQLMRKVAIKMGLKVGGGVDERKDFDKSAVGAAKLLRTICIPETNKLLEVRNIDFQPEDLWYKLLVLHVYHAGAYNVNAALHKLGPKAGGVELITNLWQTEAGRFKNASQNYSQIAVASLLELNELVMKQCDEVYDCLAQR